MDRITDGSFFSNYFFSTDTSYLMDFSNVDWTVIFVLISDVLWNIPEYDKKVNFEYLWSES